MSIVKKAHNPWKAKMKKVIQKEAYLIGGHLVKHSFMCDSPGHCAVGALMFAAGMSNDKIFEFVLGGSDWDFGLVPQLLFDTYRIDNADIDAIITTNDNNPLNRMAAVIGRIENLPRRLRVRPEEED